MKNLTALISAYARAYFVMNCKPSLISDLNKTLISQEEYIKVSKNLIEGIGFFDPNFQGNDPLKHIVLKSIGPSVIARTMLVEKCLAEDKYDQYLVLASGYDTTSFLVNKQVNCYEMDLEEMIEDKKRRVVNSNLKFDHIKYIATNFNGNWANTLLSHGFKSNTKTIVSLLGISYYLSKETFKNTLNILLNILGINSKIIIDFANSNETESEKSNQKLASGAKEEMQSKYEQSDFLVFDSDFSLSINKYFDADDINQVFFKKYNEINAKEKLIASNGVSYCILEKVKK